MQRSTPDAIANHLVRTLATTEGLNAFFERAIPLLAEAFGASRAMLIDYRESIGRFVLMYWFGYPTSTRFDLQRQAASLDLQKALTEREPFFVNDDPKTLCLP